MKEKILRLLREAGDSFVSGQKLCEKLGVSRQAVWKNITSLREAGYEIDSVPNKGYCLLSVPDRLLSPEIESRLSPECICRKVDCYDRLDSTNSRVKELAERGEPEGTLVVAEEQTAGKGRRGRDWSSEPGVGIWMSLLLRPEMRPQEISCLTLVTALAVAEGIRWACGVSTQIKWPNDVILHGKKLCGILTEMSSERDYIHYVVVGIGINANTSVFPEDIGKKATSVRLETGEKVDRPAVIAAVWEAFTCYYRKYLRTGDMTLLQEEYNRQLINLNRQVRVYYGMIENADREQTETGIARGIDREGALLVETEQGIRAVVSGEVSVRGVYGYV